MENRIQGIGKGFLMEKEEIKPEDAVERWAAFEVRWNAKRQFEPIKEG